MTHAHTQTTTAFNHPHPPQPVIPDTEGAKVLIALGSATTVFAIALATIVNQTFIVDKWLVYSLLMTAALMLGVDWIRNGAGGVG